MAAVVAAAGVSNMSQDASSSPCEGDEKVASEHGRDADVSRGDISPSQ